jgi:hypothetical protein
LRQALRVSLWLCLALLAPAAWSDASLGGGLKPDVRLLIDISGSMKESDPDNLRAPALELIVRLLPEGSRAGVWIFGEEVEELVPHRVVDAAWREQAQAAISAIDNSGQRTNIPAALAAATYDLQRMDPGYRTSIVLLTDGKVDVSQSPVVNATAARKLLAEEAPGLGRTGIPVHTIALSEEADWTFLRSLAQSTGGIAEEAGTAEELTAIYLQSLEMVAPTARVPVAGQSFQIDDSVEEFTALMFFRGARTEVGLVSPAGERFQPGDESEQVLWFSNRQFALVTVRAPQPGEWRMEAPKGATTRVTVISDLRLDVDPLPNNLPADRIGQLGIRLVEKGRVITEPNVLELFEIGVAIEGPQGRKLQIDVSSDYAAPADGEYRVTIPALEQAGRYQVTVSVEAGALQRELPMYIEVAPPPEEPTLVTRGQALPDGDLGAPLIGLGLFLLLVAVVIGWILRRRKKRKLALWEQRARRVAQQGASDPLAGISAHAEDREGDRPA